MFPPNYPPTPVLSGIAKLGDILRHGPSGQASLLDLHCSEKLQSQIHSLDCSCCE